MLDDDSPSITVKIDGHPYTLRPRELNAWQTATFEAETGISVEGMIYSLDSRAEGGRSLTMFARFAYLCALQSGQNPRSFQEVAERITYGSNIEEPQTRGLERDDDPVLPDEDDLEEARARAEERASLLESAGPEPEDPTSAADGSRADEASSSSSPDENAGPAS